MTRTSRILAMAVLVASLAACAGGGGPTPQQSLQTLDQASEVGSRAR